MKKPKLNLFLILITLLGLVACAETKDSASELLVLAGRAIALSNKDVFIQGTVKGPGSIRNASVQAFPTPADGKCVKDDGKINGDPIASAVSDENGKYSFTYRKTGGVLCVVVTPSDGSEIEVFSPITKTKSPKPWSGGNPLMAVINEPSNRSSFGIGALNKTVNVTPFTRMAARRFSALTAMNGGARLKSKVFMRISNTNTGYGARGKVGSPKVEFAANNANSLLDKATEDVENAFFPKRDKTNFELESADVEDPGYALKLGGIGIRADKYGGGSADGDSTTEDFETVIHFMEEDFSDGRFDGKKIDPTTNQVAGMTAGEFGGVVADALEADKFLSDTYKADITEYDGYDDEYAGSDEDWFFCDSDSLDAECSLAYTPGTPPEIWIFGPDGELIDLNGTTDFGQVGAGVGGSSRTAEFTIVNSGGLDLVLTLPLALTTNSQFQIVSQPSSVVAPGDAAFFQIEFTPTTATNYTDDTTVISNDEVYSPYPFTMTGEGINLGSGLVLHWEFNGNANDTSGNGLNGTVTSASLTMDLFGTANQAYNFNGSSSLINLGGSALAALSGSSSVTFSAWVSPTDTSNTRAIISQDGFELAFDSDNIVFSVDTGTATSLIYPINSFDFVDSWNLITGVYDGTNLELYVNGVSVGTQAKTGNLIGTGSFRVGTNVGSGFFSGDLDDIRIYNTALSATQIEVLYLQD
ncbi:MAG: hypothetical protein KBA66_01455 [Leptospiraceae bacterium]|nr:hypothetical protein [Leptospiraceae bacterium]